MILGIHFGSHDASAAIVENGRLLAFMEQERFDHNKHSQAFPQAAIDFCLQMAGVRQEDLCAVAYANDVELTNRFKRAFTDQCYPGAYAPKAISQSDIETKLRQHLTANVPLFHTEHHLAHAASVFYSSPFKEAAIYTVDGMGNWVTSTYGHGQGSDISILHRTPHPHSPGLYYGAVTQFLGFQAACDEGKTMGLAPYGKPKYLDQMRRIFRIEDGEVLLDLDFFTFHTQALNDEHGHPRRWFSDRFIEAFGPARLSESTLTERDADLACSAQALLEENCFKQLTHLHHLTGSDQVCVSGGVALNCSMNGRICANTPFRDLYVMPAANDAGLALGAALLASRELERGFSRSPITHAYFGSEHTVDEIEAALSTLPADILVQSPDDLASSVAALLAEYAIVGWYQGRMEFGPRALGHRSILANPTRADTKDIVNAKVKFRELFRPFAPVVPLEEVADYFDRKTPSPFMLEIVSVREDKREVIPSVTHVDGSARVQTIERDGNPLLHRLLLEMKKRNGVPVLLNTSFNIRGDTIVRTPEDALKCFMGTGMNALAIGPYLLTKRNERMQPA
ncbi:MAG: carbamoyltransferase [Alphaproteobacteria bacterium]|nr:carbamoyltransferase [Alphaproteobacteria bacterium]